MLNITFAEFDRYSYNLEKMIDKRQIDLYEYWPTREEFDSAVEVFADDIFFYVLLNYIIENNSEEADADITKKELKEFLRNHLEIAN